MANTKEITQVVNAFELWRNSRSSRRTSTPQALRKQAIDLLEQYSSSKVSSMLRISGSQLKQWRESAVEPNETRPDFIRLPEQAKVTCVVNAYPKIELRLCNGVALTFSGDISQAMLVAMIKEAKS